MSKSKKPTPPIKDLTLFESDISFFPPEYKNNLWMSQMLFFHKNSSTQLLSDARYKKYEDLDRLVINPKEYIDVIDPKTPMGEGGKAEFFAADFQEFPLGIHLDNIARTKLDKLSDLFELQVNEIDKFAKLQRQREKDRIIYQREFRQIINDLHQEVGLPPIKESQDPFSYAKEIVSKSKDASNGSIDNIVDYIRSQVQDSQTMSLYMENIYKGDIEKSFELGIQHLLINLNKWSVICQRFNKDIKNYNLMSGMFYTDEISGRPVVEYIPPTHLFTNPFSSYNGEDVTRWNYEKNVTFSDFVRMFGRTLTEDQLKEVFELNKDNGGFHGMTWNKAKTAKGSQANIRIGVFSCLTQDAETFQEVEVGGSIVWNRKPLSWIPKNGEKKQQNIYNVWYSCYYIPPPSQKLSNNSQVDWDWQSRYIFNMKKDIDMYREGTDLRYAKSKLVVWKDPRPSFTDIKEKFMPKIRLEWYQFQNCLVNDFSGVFLTQDLVAAVSNATLEANRINLGAQEGNDKKPSGGNGKDALSVAMRAMKQSGLGIAALRDSNGQMILDPTKVFLTVDNGLLNKAERHLKMIYEQYNLMTMALAQNDVTEGQLAKPRTSVEAVKAAVSSSDQGNWFMLKGASEVMIMFAERCIQHIFRILEDKNKLGFAERWEEFKNAIGVGNALSLESIEGIKPEEIALTVSLEDMSAKKNLYMQLTIERANANIIQSGDVQLILSTLEQNVKYGATLLHISEKNKAREEANKQEAMHRMAMEQKEMDYKIAEGLTAAKGAAKDKNIVTAGQVQAMIQQALGDMKQQHQLQIKDKISENRQKEATHNALLNKDIVAPPNP